MDKYKKNKLRAEGIKLSDNGEPESILDKIPNELPIVSLRDIIIFPHMIFPILAGRPATQKAVEHSIMNERLVMLLAQKDPAEEHPQGEDLYRMGVVARVLQVLRLPTGLVKILIEGVARAKVTRVYAADDFLHAEISLIDETEDQSPKIKAAFRRAINLFKEYVVLNKNLPDELILTLENVIEPNRLADFIASHIPLNLEKRQEILEEISPFDRLILITRTLIDEVEILKIEQSLDSQVREKISRSQRNYYLQEQIRVIRKELGEEAEDDYSDIREYDIKIRRAKMPKDVRKKAKDELEKMKQMPVMSPEASVIRGYLDWLIDIPWHKRTKDNLDINSAAEILDEDHYGLRKPKDRILEYLAVMKLSQNLRGQIICFVGPPGVGKTSLGRSIARALGRKFVRVSLGGMRDEAEIRGHRRTYIGSLPGRIIQQMKRAGTVNPVFLLDEVDKMATDFRGDPSSALLEALDPEQNHSFSDHYLEVDYDLSQVLFITTANVRYNIPPALLDRMEVIELPGYLQYEKYKIACDFLIPKNLKEHGLENKPVKFSENAMYSIISGYTREAGVRELERCIAQICRRAARDFVQRGEHPITVKVNSLEKFLGVPRYIEKEVVAESRVGTVNALAWTAEGGDILRIEVVLMKGKGTLTLTGNLGEVMKESAKASLSYIRSIGERFKLEEKDFLRREVHIHIPEGAVPKDGPSAGAAMTLAMLSAFTGKEIPADYGFTGEITLRGEILPIGGLPEKLMAANRLGLKTVFIPHKNMKDLTEIPPPVLKPMNIVMVKNFDEVLERVY
ncbi:MAG: endopeptidase La [candidate division Zixibacteria bacterium]|nr:endopeptidase La [Candidatus Tariuqbacter arcticus]